MSRVAILAATFAISLAAVGVLLAVPAAASGQPMADAGLDQSVTVGTTVQLDGTGSAHPDGEIGGYEWSIRTPNGREIEPECADCDRTQFTPSSVGRYEVTLTVTGVDGTESTDTLYVYVDDAGPEVELSGDRTPDPDESVTYTATAESSDAELEEIAWAVEDQIVAVRSLDGITDESSVSLAFTDTETYRVQVVVRDSNGRTAYDQLYVQPQGESSEPTSRPNAETADCGDSGYAARNPEECWNIEIPESTPEPADDSNDGGEVGPFEIRYETQGFESDMFVGMRNTDSSYLGRAIDSAGIDGGENAPWNRGLLEQTYTNTIGAGSRILFGQEERTVTCEVTGGNIVNRGCEESVFELERTGETTNVYSPTDGGSYSEYGLEGGNRTRGTNPLDLEEGERAEVTIVIQQEEDGLVDEVIEGVGSSANMVRESVDGVLDDEEESSAIDVGDQNDPHETGSSNTDWNTGNPTGGQIVSGDGDNSNSTPSNSPTNSEISSNLQIADSRNSSNSGRSLDRNGGRLVE